MQPTRTTSALFVATLLAACGSSDRASATLEATRDTVGDTIVVRTLAGSVWGAPRTLVPTGEYLGRVDAPEGMSLTPSPVFRGETVWAVTSDELGVQRVVRFEARPAPQR